MPEPRLFRGNQRVRDGVDRKRDPILHSDFAHELGYVGLDSALFDAESGADFFVGTTRDQHFQDFFLPVGKGNAAGGEDSTRSGTYALNEHGEHAARSPDRTLVHNPNGLYEFGWRGGFIYVA